MTFLHKSTKFEILNLVRMQPSITQKEMANVLDWNLASVKYLSLIHIFH